MAEPPEEPEDCHPCKNNKMSVCVCCEHYPARGYAEYAEREIGHQR